MPPKRKVQDAADALRGRLLAQHENYLRIARRHEALGAVPALRLQVEKIIAGLEHGDAVTVTGFALSAAMWSTGEFTGTQCAQIEDGARDWLVRKDGSIEPITDVTR
jgi:hypothetical protein